VEWARIEPEEGEFSAAALAHYARVLAACEEHGLTPIVTLHHFTSPRWFAARGGWEEAANVPYFGRFAERVVRALGVRIPYICTVNEPNIVASIGYLVGLFPPAKRDREARERVNENLIAGHALALAAVRGHSAA
jgi:beta-glucosidase